MSTHKNHIEQYAATPILIDLPLPIVTPRLLIRSVLPGDGIAANEAKNETFDQLHTTMAWADKPQTDDETEIIMRDEYSKFIRRENLMMIAVERTSGKAVVFTGLHDVNWKIRSFEIGYWVRASAQGNGYATEVANALTRYAFEVLHARRVVICHSDDNERSKNVIEKLGFTFEGCMKNANQSGDGRLHDTYMYARTAMADLPELDVRWGAEEERC